MSECRVCLAIRKNSRSIFEPVHQNITTSYANMITFVSSVKILQDDGITDQICLQCCKRLRDLYDFKLLIQRSNTSLHQKINAHLKIIQFNDITEFKFEIEMTQTDDKHLLKEYEDIKLNLLNTKDTYCYKGTTIKKIESSDMNVLENEPMSVIDFLKTIEDPDDNYDPDFDIGTHDEDSTDGEEYLTLNHIKNKNLQNYSKNKKIKSLKLQIKRKENDDKVKPPSKRVCIKPIILNNLRVMKTLVPKKSGPKKKVTYSRKQKESVCPYCGKISKSLQTHMLVHGEPGHKCDKCGKKYYTASRLKQHMEKHNNIKPFKCDQCVAAFYDIRTLNSHKESHLDIRKFVCDICSKSFKMQHQLRRHTRTHNSANKSHKCEQCNMSFFSSYGLRHHMRVHTGERPYNCELCSQPYSYKHDFNRHCLKKHGIFLKRRSVNVMNEEVLARERLIMKELMLRARGLKDGDPEIPFEGPQAAQAYEQAIRTFRTNPLALTLQT